MEYQPIKRNEVPIHAIPWLNLGNITLREGKQSQNIILFYLYEMSKVGKSLETESRPVVATGWGQGGRGVTADGDLLPRTRCLSEGNERVLESEW